MRLICVYAGLMLGCVEDAPPGQQVAREHSLDETPACVTTGEPLPYRIVAAGRVDVEITAQDRLRYLVENDSDEGVTFVLRISCESDAGFTVSPPFEVEAPPGATEESSSLTGQNLPESAFAVSGALTLEGQAHLQDGRVESIESLRLSFHPTCCGVASLRQRRSDGQVRRGRSDG